MEKQHLFQWGIKKLRSKTHLLLGLYLVGRNELLNTFKILYLQMLSLFSCDDLCALYYQEYILIMAFRQPSLIPSLKVRSNQTESLWNDDSQTNNLHIHGNTKKYSLLITEILGHIKEILNVTMTGLQGVIGYCSSEENSVCSFFFLRAWVSLAEFLLVT